MVGRPVGDARRAGRLIVLEGGEASGKSTQAGLLAEKLGALLTREPGGTAIGEQLRELILDPTLPPLDPRAEVLMLLAARAQHVSEVIAPALADAVPGSIANQEFGKLLPKLIDGSLTAQEFCAELTKKAAESAE